MGSGCGGGYGGSGLQAVSPCQGTDQAYGGGLPYPVWPSGIPATRKGSKKRRVKKKCALATLLTYYRQGQEVIDWSGGGFSKSKKRPGAPCPWGQNNGSDE